MSPYLRFDAIVFDLDDTLLDTTAQLMEPAHREAAAAMVAAGLPGEVEALLLLRLELQRAHPSEDTNELAAAAHGLPKDHASVEAGRSTYFRRRIDALEPFPWTLPVLDALRGRTRLLLLTVGDPGTQRTKIRLLGIGSYFEDVVVLLPDAGDKRAGLRALLRHHRLEAARVVVVGDRLDREISAGRSIGAWTVRVAHGEGGGAAPGSPEEQPHYTVSSIEALPAVLDDIEQSEERPA